jgi:hypothetical protein
MLKTFFTSFSKFIHAETQRRKEYEQQLCASAPLREVLPKKNALTEIPAKAFIVYMKTR